MSMRAAGCASEFLKEVALGMQVLANERIAAKAEAPRGRSGGGPGQGARLPSDDAAAGGLDNDEALAKHCLSTRLQFLTASTFYKAGPENHKHRLLNKTEDVDKVFQWIVQRKVARHPSRTPNGTKCKPIEKCSWTEIQNEPIARACVQKLGLLRDCFA